MDGVAISHDVVLVLDFGSQYTHLIARRLRECAVYCELVAHDTSAAEIEKRQPPPRGIVLSGGPSSVYEDSAPHVDPAIFELEIPVLGICYGLQEMCRALGGRVEPGNKREFGHATLQVQSSVQCELLNDVPKKAQVWMSHGDKVVQLPDGFTNIAATDAAEFSIVQHSNGKLFGVQFHPEVTHTPNGTTILNNFARGVCKCRGDWTMAGFADEAITAIRNTVGEGRVVGAVSGGVDSTVAATLVSRAVGDRFHAVLVDNGLLRQDEANEVVHRLRDRCGVNVSMVDASERFLELLIGVKEPEKKRKVIGSAFIDVFEVEAERIDAQWLLQGTLYPDVIESGAHLHPDIREGKAATIKTHHNVGGLPERMHLKLLEPLRALFKDEVRALGAALGLESPSLSRHPFPGPGLAIRVLGEVTKTRLQTLRAADAIYISELRHAALYEKVAQAFAVLLPVRAVGVMGDKRTYEEVIAIRAVTTSDYMTADWADLPSTLLRRVSTRIVNEVPGVNRVTYDITSKPPGTIEWE